MTEREIVTVNPSSNIQQGDQSSSVISSENSGIASRLWRYLTLLAILLLSLALRLWNSAQNGWGNEYYTAGVFSKTISWSNFLYNSFDPAGFVSVDKPPVAMWIQTAFVKLFGLHGFSVLMPQVLEGVASVWILYHLVQRRFGASAGLVAGLFLAITPISVAIDRSSNTDSLLVLVLLLAAWALMRAAEEGSRRFLVLSMALIGLGFNVKMLAAYVVLPTFWLVYLLGAPLTLRRRLLDLTLAGVVLVITSLAWVAVYDLTPKDQRPFAGTTQHNSMLELAIGPYAVGRFVPVVKRPETARSDSRELYEATTGTQLAYSTTTPAEAKIRNQVLRLFVRAPVGPLRLADGHIAGQAGWLFPLAVMGLLVGLFQSTFRRPLAPRHQALFLWLGWAVTYGIVYSYAGGIMHLYYFSTMAPPLAALAAIGVVSLWERYLQKGWIAIFLPVILLLTALWELHIQASALGWKFGEIANPLAAITPLKAEDCIWLAWLHVALVVGTLVAVVGLLVMIFRRSWSKLSQILATGALGTGLFALLLLPFVWALSSVLTPGHGVLPSADLARLVSSDGNSYVSTRSTLVERIGACRLVGFLQANHQGERYLLSTSTTGLAAPIIINTGKAVMARGGFHGLDPILTPEKLAQMVKSNQVRFMMLGDLSYIDRILGAEEAGKPIAEWVQVNGKLVDPSLWRSSMRERRMNLYDLKPSLGLIPPT